MSRFVGIFALLGMFYAVIGSINQAQAVTRLELKEQMRNKLEHSQDVLSGIITEDYEQLEEAANGLAGVCEIVGWTEAKTKGRFKTHDTEFHEIANELVILAKERNLEGALYKYIQMTTICMDCHQHVRDVEAPEKYTGGIHEGEYLHEGRHVHSR